MTSGVIGFTVLGIAFVIVSLPDGTTTLAQRDGWGWLAWPAQQSRDLEAALWDYGELLTWITYALMAYGSTLFLLALRHGRPSLFARGVVVLALSVSVLHGIAWIGYGLYHAANFMVWLAGVILGFIGDVATAVGDFVVQDVLGVFKPLVGSWSWLLFLLLLAVVLGMAIQFGSKRVQTIAATTVLLLIAGAILIGFVYVMQLPSRRTWTGIGDVVVWIIAAIGLLLVFATVGQLFWDQLRSTFVAGNDRIGVTMGAIAIGSTLALLMLVGNVYSVYGLYPHDIAVWAQEAVLTKQGNDPKFDATVSLTIISLSTLGVMRNVIRMRREPDLREYRKSLVYTVLGVLTAGSLAAVAKQTES